MEKNKIINNKGQATLEFFLLVAFLTIAIVFAVKIFFPEIQKSFISVGSIVESAIETGSKFK